MKNKFYLRQLSGIFIGSFLLLLLLAGGCYAPKTTPFVAPVAAVAAFVAENQCESCHSEIYKNHSHTRHSATLRVATTEELGPDAPPTGAIPNTPFSIKRTGNRFLFSSKSDNGKSNLIDYALGSGKLAMTYVSVHEDQTLTELRMSWYPGVKKWYITPGQESMTESNTGYRHDSPTSKSCILCHASNLPEKSLRPTAESMGVRCQSCHGPASVHLEAVKSGSADIKMEKLGKWTATQINELCGKCHRSNSQVGNSGNDITMTQRFQPYGLSQSKCFQKSGDTLTCMTCHDSHAKLAKDESVYVKACLNCHNGADRQLPDKTMMKSVICPVNSKAKCIGCHMPSRKVFPISKLPISMADHLIWAYRKKQKQPN